MCIRDRNKVGIGTTLPEYTLHIGIGAGARGGIGVTDIHVSGIATIGVANSTSGALSVTGISTFDGLIDANGGVSARTAAVQDLTDNRVVIAGTGGELEDSANLTFDGSTLTVTGDLDPTNVSIASTLQVAGVATFLSGTLVSGIGTFESDIDAEGTVTVGTGITLQPHGGVSIAGIVTVGGDLNLGGDITLDEISARNLILTGIATIPTLGVTGLGTFEKLTVGTGVTLQEHGGVSIAGITTINGNLLVGGDILPNADGAKDLGASGNEFQDLFIDGTANIDSLSADTAIIGDLTDNRVVIAGSGGELEDSGNLTFDGTTLNVTGSFTAGTAASVHSSTGNAAFAGIVTANGGLAVGSAASIHSNGNASFSGVTTIGGTLQANGDVDLGNATSDTITATGRFDSDLVPSANDPIDLGTS